MTVIKKIAIFFWLILLIFSRFFNLENNLKFNRDESSDLVKIHQYWQDKKISLIGPISEDRKLVYSSLSYYLVMPATVIFKFTAVSPSIGTAFWSVITGILMVFWLIKKRSSILDWILVLIWFPLLITGRWAWNPNLITLWMILGWLLVNSKNKTANFFGALAFGLTTHHHYLGFIPAFILCIFCQNYKKIGRTVLNILGLFLPLILFIVFDLTHKPGLFITRFFMFKESRLGFNLNSFKVCGEYLLGNGVLFWIALFLVLLMLIWEILNKKYQKWYCWLAIILLIAVVSIINNQEEHYFIGAIIPFWIWITERRNGIGKYIRTLLLIILIISSTQKSIELIYGRTPDDSAFYAQKISDMILNDIYIKKSNNSNIAVLQSSDINSYGMKYRDLLLIKNIRLKEPDEINISDNLYVITQSNNIIKLKNDASDQMQRFKNGPETLIGEVGNNWKVYRFNLY